MAQAHCQGIYQIHCSLKRLLKMPRCAGLYMGIVSSITATPRWLGGQHACSSAAAYFSLQSALLDCLLIHVVCGTEAA